MKTKSNAPLAAQTNMFQEEVSLDQLATMKEGHIDADKAVILELKGRLNEIRTGLVVLVTQLQEADSFDELDEETLIAFQILQAGLENAAESLAVTDETSSLTLHQQARLLADVQFVSDGYGILLDELLGGDEDEDEDEDYDDEDDEDFDDEDEEDEDFEEEEEEEEDDE